ncbi:hypothetical protein QZH41_015865 [Actinostola sp. cb2023]|nr:hypothetical protein QZH41_015865 [Actinostola sp. cb2023]
MSDILPYQFEPIAPHNLTDEDEFSSEDESDENNEEQHERVGNVEWCSCNNCKTMHTGTESVCCRENAKVLDKLPEGLLCITKLEDFTVVCLNKAVLETALSQYVESEGFIDDEPLNDTYRYIAYRQWTYWTHGKLGKKIRIPIPSCVVAKIRNCYPSEYGQYKGFEYAR